MTSDQHIEHIQTGQRVIRHSSRPNFFYFFPTAQNILKFYHRTIGTFASRTTCPALAGSPSTDQSLQKSFHLSHADKIELKKISSPSENKKYASAQPNDKQKSIAMQTTELMTGNRFKYSVDRRRLLRPNHLVLALRIDFYLLPLFTYLKLSIILVLSSFSLSFL